MNDVILLNSDYTTLGLIHWKKAVRLMFKKKVEVVKYSEKKICNYEKTFSFVLPLVIKLVKYVRTIYGKKISFNKRNLLIRDNHTCLYCGKKLDERNSSIDHIVPRSIGGKSSWENCVSACIPCNNRKDNKTCKEANMFPHSKPTAPTVMEFIMLQLKHSGMNGLLKEIGLI